MKRFLVPINQAERQTRLYDMESDVTFGVVALHCCIGTLCPFKYVCLRFLLPARVYYKVVVVPPVDHVVDRRTRKHLAVQTPANMSLSVYRAEQRNTGQNVCTKHIKIPFPYMSCTLLGIPDPKTAATAQCGCVLSSLESGSAPRSRGRHVCAGSHSDMLKAT